jgi:hypothetical protein
MGRRGGDGIDEEDTTVARVRTDGGRMRKKSTVPLFYRKLSAPQLQIIEVGCKINPSLKRTKTRPVAQNPNHPGMKMCTKHKGSWAKQFIQNINVHTCI